MTLLTTSPSATFLENGYSMDHRRPKRTSWRNASICLRRKHTRIAENLTYRYLSGMNALRISTIYKVGKLTTPNNRSGTRQARADILKYVDPFPSGIRNWRLDEDLTISCTLYSYLYPIFELMNNISSHIKPYRNKMQRRSLNEHQRGNTINE